MSQRTTNPALTAEDLTFRFHKDPVIDHLSLELEPGRFLAILGPNGAGKSTLLRLLCGFLKPDTGRVLVQQGALAGLPQTIRASRIGVKPQFVSTYFPFTALEMVEMGAAATFGGLAASREIRARALQAMDRLGLRELDGRSFPTLSGGEQQLVCIAKLIAQDPAVWLLDEPIASLDVSRALGVMRLLAAEAAQGRCVACVLHDLNMALAHCDCFLVLSKGRTIFFGTRDRLLESDALARAYGTDFEPLRHPRSGKTLMVPRDL